MWGRYRSTPRFSTESEDSSTPRDRSIGSTPTLELDQFWAEDNPILPMNEQPPPYPGEAQAQGAFRPITPQHVPRPETPHQVDEMQQLKHLLHGVLTVPVSYTHLTLPTICSV